MFIIALGFVCGRLVLFLFLILSADFCIDRNVGVEHLINRLKALHSSPDTARSKQADACCLLCVFSFGWLILLLLVD